jgi:TonB-linked SusC/RagA family outer membrane protein
MNRKLQSLKNRTLAVLSLSAVLMVLCSAAWAQQQISGKVLAEDGETLPGVNVLLEGTSTGTATDANGEFKIEVPGPDAVLVFSFIGYVTERITVANQVSIELRMTPDLQTLGEVVVVGYGTQKRVNMTAAVSTITAEDVTSRQSPNTISLLQGRTPGLQIVQNSAQPGAENNDIRIRGQGTFSTVGNPPVLSTSPLVLIDGVEGKLELLNPNMIAEVSVLKDAASAAIYGSRAANGVILVTTKSGKEGRLTIDYSYTYTSQNPSIKIDRVTNSVEYMELMNKAIAHSGRQPTWAYTQAQIDAYREGAKTNPKQFPSSDWTDELIRTAPIHKHFLGINGGKAGTTFNVGLGYLDETGLLLATAYKRYDAQINFKTNLGGRVTFGSNISMAKGKRHDSALTTGSTGPQLIDSNASEDQMLSAYAAPPLATPRLADGSGRYTAYAYPAHGGNKNPIAIATDGGGKEFVNNYILFTPYVDVKVTDELTAQVKGSVRFQEEMAKALVVSSYGFEFHPDANGIHNQQAVWNGGSNSLAQRNTRENHYTVFATLKYDKVINTDHTVSALLGHQTESFRYDRVDAYRTKLPSKKLWELAAGPPASQTTGSDAYEWALQSFFGRANYDYKGKYLFEVSARYDGSSRFPSDNRWALFPSVSGGWRASEEAFLNNVSWINELKVRGSWGQLGNQTTGYYPYQDILAFTTTGESLDANFGGVLTQGIAKRAINNPNIKWETTTVTDFGIDFALVNSKLFGSIDWYNKTTKDILRPLQLPDHVGMNSPLINNGTMKNTGWEFLIGYREKIGDFGFTVSANLETYKNELVEFGSREINGINLRQEGDPWNTYYLLIQDGVYQTQEEVDNGPTTSYTSVKPKPGDLKFKDISGPNGVPDGVINLQYDRKKVDGIFPKFNYGMNISATFKNFDLSVFFQGVYGRKTYVTGWGVSPFNQASAPPTFWKTDAWDGAGTSNHVPAVYVDSQYAPNAPQNTFWLGNSSYLRLKNVQLGYTLPAAWSQKVRMQHLRVYAAADNIVTFTNFFQGLDPERAAVNTSSGSSSTANLAPRAAIYPQATLYSFGVNATF